MTKGPETLEFFFHSLQLNNLSKTETGLLAKSNLFYGSYAHVHISSRSYNFAHFSIW